VSVKTIEKAEIYMVSLVDDPLPGMEGLTVMCGYRQGDWHCASEYHGEEPNNHYFVKKS